MNLFQKITMKKIKAHLNDHLKHECYKALNNNNIKLWIWYKYHTLEYINTWMPLQVILYTECSNVNKNM